MKKLFLIALPLFFLGMMFTSCEKCSTCKVTETSNDSLIFTYPEQCGKKSDIEDYENAAEAAYPAASGYKITCEE